LKYRSLIRVALKPIQDKTLPVNFSSLAILVPKDFRLVGFAPPVFTGFALIDGMKMYREKRAPGLFTRAPCREKAR